MLAGDKTVALAVMRAFTASWPKPKTPWNNKEGTLTTVGYDRRGDKCAEGEVALWNPSTLVEMVARTSNWSQMPVQYEAASAMGARRRLARIQSRQPPH